MVNGLSVQVAELPDARELERASSSKRRARRSLDDVLARTANVC
jgi:hypothetical protein